MLGTGCTFKRMRQWVPKFNSGYQGSTIASHASGSMNDIGVLIKVSGVQVGLTSQPCCKEYADAMIVYTMH